MCICEPQCSKACQVSLYISLLNADICFTDQIFHLIINIISIFNKRIVRGHSLCERKPRQLEVVDIAGGKLPKVNIAIQIINTIIVIKT